MCLLVCLASTVHRQDDLCCWGVGRSGMGRSKLTRIGGTSVWPHCQKCSLQCHTSWERSVSRLELQGGCHCGGGKWSNWCTSMFSSAPPVVIFPWSLLLGRCHHSFPAALMRSRMCCRRRAGASFASRLISLSATIICAQIKPYVKVQGSERFIL